MASSHNETTEWDPEQEAKRTVSGSSASRNFPARQGGSGD